MLLRSAEQGRVSMAVVRPGSPTLRNRRAALPLDPLAEGQAVTVRLLFAALSAYLWWRGPEDVRCDDQPA